MKITGALFPGRAVVQPKQSFQAVLHQQKPLQQHKPTPPPLPNHRPMVPPGMKPVSQAVATGVVARAAGVPCAQQVFALHEKTTGALTIARAASNQSAAHLQEARVAHHHLVNERLDGRLVDLICKELVVEFTADPSKFRGANQDLPLAPPIAGLASVPRGVDPTPRPVVDGSVRAAQAVELIERIETFIKDSRHPSIALTLNNSLGAKVEIERVGPREVALKIVGHKGPPPAEDISRIRDEMQARGLKVCALSIA